MTVLVVIFGALIAALGAAGVVRPRVLIGFVDSAWRSPRGIYGIVAARLVLGVVLVVAAPDCRFPEIVRVLGILSLVSAVLLPLLGRERLRPMIEWWISRPDGFLRAWSLVAVAFGIFVGYAGI
jgi:hypothetical protein